MAIEGNLAHVGLADICQLLAMGRKTGCLTVKDEGNLGYVHFEAGRVIYATVMNRPERLGDLLVASGAIEREQLGAALQRHLRLQGSLPGTGLQPLDVKKAVAELCTHLHAITGEPAFARKG